MNDDCFKHNFMNVLLISSDTIDAQMAGPGIRYWEFARQLAARHTVLLLTPNQSSLTHPQITLRQHTGRALTEALRQADVVVTQGFGFSLAPLMRTQTPLVVDLSFPLTIELLEHHTHLPLQAAQLSHSYCVARTKMLLRRGDFFLYSHAHLRDYWLGMFTAVGRLQPQSYRHDRNADRLFGCVPFGLAAEPPQRTRPAFGGAQAIFPQAQIHPDTDTLILWGGGLWRWFDPATVIRAMGAIAKTRADIKLVFICGKKPGTATTGVNIAYAKDEAVALSQELGIYNRTVFFNEAWVPYQDRGSYFLDMDIGISTHFENLETRFSFRTRVLDYLWAELPIITTGGDALSELIVAQQLGIVVAPGDVAQVQQAILKLADDREFAAQCRANIRRVREQFFWQRVTQPLLTFCDAPYRTSPLTPITAATQLLTFYLHTGKILLQYRGYRKLWAKIRQRLT